jgi:hypothetical protein
MMWCTSTNVWKPQIKQRVLSRHNARRLGSEMLRPRRIQGDPDGAAGDATELLVPPLQPKRGLADGTRDRRSTAVHPHVVISGDIQPNAAFAVVCAAIAAAAAGAQMIGLRLTDGTGRDGGGRRLGGALRAVGIHWARGAHLPRAMSQARRGIGRHETITVGDGTRVLARPTPADMTDAAVELREFKPAELARATRPVPPGQRQFQLLRHRIAL